MSTLLLPICSNFLFKWKRSLILCWVQIQNVSPHKTCFAERCQLIFGARGFPTSQNKVIFSRWKGEQYECFHISVQILINLCRYSGIELGYRSFSRLILGSKKLSIQITILKSLGPFLCLAVPFFITLNASGPRSKTTVHCPRRLFNRFDSPFSFLSRRLFILHTLCQWSDNKRKRKWGTLWNGFSVVLIQWKERRVVLFSISFLKAANKDGNEART